MILTFDRTTYSNLLAEIAPKAIETEEEYDRLLAVAQRLTFAKNLTPEEKILYKLLVTIIKINKFVRGFFDENCDGKPAPDRF